MEGRRGCGKHDYDLLGCLFRASVFLTQEFEENSAVDLLSRRTRIRITYDLIS